MINDITQIDYTSLDFSKDYCLDVNDYIRYIYAKLDTVPTNPVIEKFKYELSILKFTDDVEMFFESEPGDHYETQMCILISELIDKFNFNIKYNLLDFRSFRNLVYMFLRIEEQRREDPNKLDFGLLRRTQQQHHINIEFFENSVLEYNEKLLVV